MTRTSCGPGLAVALGILLAAPAAYAQTSQAQAQAAFEAGVTACVSVIDGGTPPDRAFASAGFGAPTPPHAALKKFFYPDATDSRWYLRQFSGGVVRTATAASDQSCSVFLLSFPGREANKQLPRVLPGWTRESAREEGVIYVRRNASGDMIVVSIHDGAPEPLPEQIGAMVRVYVLGD